MVADDPLVDITHVANLKAVLRDGVPVDFAKLPTPPVVTAYPRDADG